MSRSTSSDGTRVTVSREADRFASVMVDTADIEHVAQPQEVVGVDLGIAALVTPSRGKPILVPKEHMILIKKVAQVVGRREPEAKRLPQSRQG